MFPESSAVNATRIRLKVIIPLLGALGLLAVGFLVYHADSQNRLLARTLNRVALTFDKLITSELTADVGIMSTALEPLVRDEEIQRGLREKNVRLLSTIVRESYEHLKATHEITHFYFHGTDLHNLYRMHEPSHAGDLIERKTLREAQTSGRPSFGVEQGPTGASVLRVVYPVFAKKKLIGFLELGKEFQDIATKIQKLLSVEMLVFVEKDKVDKKKWEKRNNKESYKVDWGFAPTQVIMASSLKEIPSPLKQLKFMNTSDAHVADLQFERGGYTYNAITYPFADKSGARNTHIVLLFDSTSIHSTSKKAIAIGATVSIGTVLLLLLFFFFYLGGVEKLVVSQQALLIEVSKMASLGQMAGGVAHEINTPLGIINMLAGQVKDELESDTMNKKFMEESLTTIESTVERAAKIILGLKTISRDSERTTLTDVSVKSVIEDTIAFGFEGMRSRSINLQVAEIPEDLAVQGTPTEISQVILNLVNNACDAIEKKSEKWIEISVMAQADSVQISVTDSGDGIRQEIRQRIFDPFFTTKGVGRGTGLGLSIAAGIVKKFGGRLELDERSKNTRFILTLPRANRTVLSADQNSVAAA